MRRSNGSEGAAKVGGTTISHPPNISCIWYLFPTAQHIRLRFWPFFA